MAGTSLSSVPSSILLSVRVPDSSALEGDRTDRGVGKEAVKGGRKWKKRERRGERERERGRKREREEEREIEWLEAFQLVPVQQFGWHH